MMLKSPNVYQMFAYMRHYPNPRNLPMTGILLYPRNDRALDLTAVSRHNPDERIRFKTVDLSRPWAEIRAQLVSIVE